MKHADIIADDPSIVKRVAIYVRVSTTEQKQHGISIDDQISSLKSWVEANRFKLVDIYNDAGISARARYKKRPEMLRMLQDCKNGKIDLIVFTKLDRFFRNVRDFYEVDSILTECGVTWKTTREDYETETAAGRLKFNLMLAIAQDEADRTSERVKATFEYKRSIGEWSGGTPPIGYVVRDKKLIKNPAEEALINEVFESYILYQSMYKAASQTGLTVERVRWILHSETYVGMYRGSQCEAYITAEQHQKILSMLQKRSRKPAHNNIYLFSGLIRCGVCGKAYAGLRAVTGKNRYRCSSMSNDGKPCGNPTFSEEWLESVMISIIDDDMRKTKPTKIQTHKKGTSTEQLERRLERLKDLYIDGDISKQRYDKQKAEITAKINAIKASEAAQDHESPELPDYWLDEYNALDQARKRIFWHGITDVITCIGKKITVEWY